MHILTVSKYINLVYNATNVAYSVSVHVLYIYSTGFQKPLVVHVLSVDLWGTIMMLIVMKKNPGPHTASHLHLNLFHQRHHKNPMTRITVVPLKHCMTLSQVKHVGRKTPFKYSMLGMYREHCFADLPPLVIQCMHTVIAVCGFHLTDRISSWTRNTIAWPLVWSW